MDYKFILLLGKKDLQFWDVTETETAEEINLDFDTGLDYQNQTECAKLVQAVCETYAVDSIEELDAGLTIVNCGVNVNSCLSLMGALNDFKSLDTIDVKKLLPLVLANKDLLKVETRIVVKVIDKCYSIQCDSQGLITVVACKPVEEAVVVTGRDFGLLYFYRDRNVAKNAELAAYEDKLAKATFAMQCLQVEKERELAELRSELESKYKTIIATIESENEEYKNALKYKEDIQIEKDIALDGVHIGDIIKLGRYYTDNSKQMNAIDWQVLDIEANKALLLCHKAVDCLPYDAYNNHWVACSLRMWLNTTFYTMAFAENERNRICSTDIEPCCNDKVFLLSVEEFNKYLLNNESRTCVATEYAVAKGAAVDNYHCYWWLRTSGQNDFGSGGGPVALIQCYGILDLFGCTCYRNNIAVRPAIWINIK